MHFYQYEMDSQAFLEQAIVVTAGVDINEFKALLLSRITKGWIDPNGEMTFPYVFRRNCDPDQLIGDKSGSEAFKCISKDLEWNTSQEFNGDNSAFQYRKTKYENKLAEIMYQAYKEEYPKYKEEYQKYKEEPKRYEEYKQYLKEIEENFVDEQSEDFKIYDMIHYRDIDKDINKEEIFYIAKLKDFPLISYFK